ncbi:MAG: CoA-binding protein [Bacteroidales bacterium]|nr:CoA-binding protein [Bacteroidales bacterium]
MASLNSIQDFLSQKHIAVAGVSRKKQKFGNAIYKELKNKGYTLYPINPHMDEYDGTPCYHSIDDLPEEVSGIVINTKNEVTLKLLEQARSKGIKHIWLQQGCANKDSLAAIESNGSNIISKQCIMMFANPVGGIHGFHRWIKKSFGKFPN